LTKESVNLANLGLLEFRVVRGLGAGQFQPIFRALSFSFIDYRFTRLEKAGFVATKVQAGEFIEKEPCSPELIKRIIQGR
jgi:hypothetical protein